MLGVSVQIVWVDIAAGERRMLGPPGAIRGGIRKSQLQPRERRSEEIGQELLGVGSLAPWNGQSAVDEHQATNPVWMANGQASGDIGPEGVTRHSRTFEPPALQHG